MTCSECGCDTLGPGVCVDCSSNRFHDYPRLKKENEQLKKNLPDMTKWTIGLIIKELEEHPEYTANEILQRHRDLYRDSPASKYLENLEESNQAHIEACGQWNEKCYKLQQEIEQLKAISKRLDERIEYVKARSNITDPNCTDWNIELSVLTRIRDGEK